MIAPLLFCISAFLSSVAFVWAVRKAAYRWNWISPPRPDRWHSKPTALYGGIGIFLSFAINGLAAYLWDGTFPSRPLFIVLFLGGFGAFVLGLVDDMLRLKPISKLTGQVALASLFIAMGGQFDVSSYAVVDILFTYFWFIGIINAINFLDNMDGLASGVVVVSASALAVLMSLAGTQVADPTFITVLIFIFSVLGFLVFNFSPASIFMGDAGSLFLGYTLAALTIPNTLSRYETAGNFSPLMGLLIPVAIMGIPIFDTTLVTISRKFSGKSVMTGGRDHSSHRLVGLGFSEKTSVLILYALAAIGGAAAVAMSLFPGISVFIFGLFLVLFLVIGIYLGKRKVYSRESSSEKPGFTPLVGHIMYKKGMIEVILDVILASLCYFSAFLILGLDGSEANFRFFRSTIPLVIFATIVVFRLCRVYKGLWHLLAVEDMTVFLKGVLFSLSAVVVLNAVLAGPPPAWGLYPVYGLLLFFSVVGSRLSFRFFDTIAGDYGLADRPVKILIYGAGVGGKMIADEIKRNEAYREFHPLGFLEDDDVKHGRSISGIRILGGLESLPKILSKNGCIREIWVSTKKIDAERLDELRKALPEKVSIKKMFLQITPF